MTTEDNSPNRDHQRALVLQQYELLKAINPRRRSLYERKQHLLAYPEKKDRRKDHAEIKKLLTIRLDALSKLFRTSGNEQAAGLNDHPEYNWAEFLKRRGGRL